MYNPAVATVSQISQTGVDVSAHYDSAALRLINHVN